MNSNISDCSCGFCLNPVGQPVPCSDLASHHFECSMVPDHHSQDHIHLATWPFKITWKPSSPLFEQGYCAEARCQLGRERDQGIACYQHQQYKSASISNRNLFQEPVVIPRKCRPIMGPLNIPIFHQSEHDTQQTRERTTFRRDETK